MMLHLALLLVIKLTSPYMTMEDNSFFILVPKKYFLIEYEYRFIVKVMSMPKFTVEIML